MAWSTTFWMCNGRIIFASSLSWRRRKPKQNPDNLNHCLHPEGLKNDELITKQIKEFFSLKGEHRIDHLDEIGFITQSSLARLTHTQQNIFDSILAIFGSDVAQNIFRMVTFADGQKLLVIVAVKEVNIPFSHFFKFNNLALFAATKSDDEEDNFDEMFWKMGIASFKF